MASFPSTFSAPSGTPSLADEIRKRWGQYGNWAPQGIDRTDFVANALTKAGITNLDQFGQYKFDKEVIPGNVGEQGEWMPETFNNYLLDPSGQRIGRNFQANVPLSNGTDVLFDASGHGGVDFQVIAGPDGSPVIVPQWRSTSGWKDARGLAKGAAYIGAAATGMNAAFGAGAGAGAGGMAQASYPEAFGLAEAAGSAAPVAGASVPSAGDAAFLEANAGAMAPGVSGGYAAPAVQTGSNMEIADLVSKFGSKLGDQLMNDPLKTLSLAGSIGSAFAAKPGSAPSFDPIAAATAQGNASKDASLFDTMLNRPDQVTPYGTMKWTLRPGADPKNPQPGDWTQTLAFTPEQEALQRSQTGVSQGLADATGGALGRVQSTLANPLDLSSAPALATLDPNTLNRDAVYEAMLARLRPEWARDEESTRTRALNTGFNPGSEGMDRELERLDRAKTDAQIQAFLASGQELSRAGQDSRANATFANQARQQAIEEAMLQRQLPLSELNALRSGAMPQLPEFKSFSTTNTAASPVMDALLAQLKNNQANYANDQAGYNALLAALGQLGGAWIGGKP